MKGKKPMTERPVGTACSEPACLSPERTWVVTAHGGTGEEEGGMCMGGVGEEEEGGMRGGGALGEEEEEEGGMCMGGVGCERDPVFYASSEMDPEMPW